MDCDALQSFCRICVQKTDVKCCMFKVLRQKKTMSLHIMLEKMFPSVFNMEQEQCIDNLYRPTKLCKTCKDKVIDAYKLYEMCEESETRLQACVAELQYAYEDQAKEGNAEMGSITTHYEITIEGNFDTEEDVAQSETDNLADAPVEVKIEREAAIPDQPIADENNRRSSRVRRVPQKDLPATIIVKNIVKQDVDGEEEEKDMLVFECIDEKMQTSSDYEEKPQLSGRGRGRGRKPSTKGKPNTAQNQKNSVARGMNKLSKRMSVKMEDDSSDQPFDQDEELESKVDVYPCQICDGPPYNSPKQLTIHLRSEHPDQIRSCDKCPKVFMSEQAFQHHQYCHATGRSHFCMFCDKGFQLESLLKSHIRSHTHGAEFLCSLCGKKFNNKSNLRQHAMRHTGIKPWACSLCPSRFCTKGALNLHQRTHTKTKLFSCDSCGSQFNTRYSLIKHHLVHSGERPYKCDVCDMRFVSTYHVKRHMLTHTGEKPFKCTYCERSFAQSNDMVKHMKTHVGNTPYQCNICEESFRLLTDLRNHYREHYQGDDEGTIAVAVEDKAIRFTSTDILKLRYEKEMNHSSEMCETKPKVLTEATVYPDMFEQT